MKSFLFFLCFTFIASLYIIVPSIITTFLSVVGVTMLSGFVLALKLVPSRSRYDPLMTGHGGTSYDIQEMLFIVPPLVNLLFAAAAIFAVHCYPDSLFFDSLLDLCYPDRGLPDAPHQLLSRCER